MTVVLRNRRQFFDVKEFFPCLVVHVYISKQCIERDFPSLALTLVCILESLFQKADFTIEAALGTLQIAFKKVPFELPFFCKWFIFIGWLSIDCCIVSRMLLVNCYQYCVFFVLVISTILKLIIGVLSVMYCYHVVNGFIV